MFFVTADEQYAGKGRNGKVWEGESYQNVYLSLAIDETQFDTLKNKWLYQVIGCLAVKSALKENVDNSIKLKYPNDVYIQDEIGKYKKISGVLSEHSYSGNRCTETILGIGININQGEFGSDLVDKATSLKLLGHKAESSIVVHSLKNSLNNLFACEESEIYSAWIDELNLLGKKIVVVGKTEQYKVVDIDKSGTILARNGNEEIKINNGDSIIYDLR